MLVTFISKEVMAVTIITFAADWAWRPGPLPAPWTAAAVLG
jgi:hypothetical protein